MCKSEAAPVCHAAMVGSGRLRFEARDDWAQLPDGWDLREIPGVAVDSRDRVYVFSRSDHPVTVFDRKGRLVDSWGQGLFHRPHAIATGPDDAVYCVDDFDHVVHKFMPDGRLLMTLGERGKPSDTGIEGSDYRTMKQAAGPFNLPTDVAVTPEGDLYVADGYGNTRIHRFSAEGRLLQSWGEPGKGPGQFGVPHGIMISREGILYVADRENSRIQRFGADGEFIDEWTDVARPSSTVDDRDGHIYVAETGFRAGLYPGNPVPPNPPGSRVSVFGSGGELLARWGGGDNPGAPGDFFCAHGIGIDSHGDLYVNEVRPGAFELGDSRPAGLAARLDVPLLQKFIRH